MNIYTPSLLGGLGIAMLVGITMAQQIVGSPAVEVRVVELPIAHQPAHPRDLLRIVEGTPFTTPPGKVLVLTELGFLGQVSGNNPQMNVSINGIQILREVTSLDGGRLSAPIPAGITASPGSTVAVEAPNTTAILLGYLADA